MAYLLNNKDRKDKRFIQRTGWDIFFSFLPIIGIIVIGVTLFFYASSQGAQMSRDWEVRNMDPKQGKVQYERFGEYYWCEGTTMIVQDDQGRAGGMATVPGHPDCQ